MSETSLLNCYVLGDDAHRIFSVDIDINPPNNVSVLKCAIRNMRFPDILSHQLTVWKVSIAVDQNFQQNVDPRHFKDDESLLPVKRLAGLFAEPLDPEHVHIVVRQPLPPVVPPVPVQQHTELKVTNNVVIDDEEYDEVKEMWRGVDMIFANPGMGETPSQNLKSNQHRRHQETGVAILDGRYGKHCNTTLAPPVELYHPVFAEFKAHLANMSLEPPSDVVSNTVELMVSTSEIKGLEGERKNIRSIIAKLCKFGVARQENGDKTSPDYACTVARTLLPVEVALVAVFEEKSELGVNGDPTIQASFSYHQSLRTGSCCPSFIIGSAGPWIAICGGVIAGHPIVERLTDYIWLGHSRVTDDTYAFRVAKIFYSLRLAVQSLSNYYLNSQLPPIKKSRVRFFPSITSYKVGEQTIEFEYLKPLEHNEPVCVTYLARRSILQTNIVQHIVVKFVERYGEKAHRLLAAKRLAPQLFYFGLLTSPQDAVRCSYGNLHMVVMEYVEGRTAGQLYDNVPVPPALKKVVQRAQKCLAEASLVHGDLRKPNILIPNDGGVENALIIDFDWAGEADKVRYPLHLSTAPGLWVDGVESYGLIQLAHDEAMVNRL